MYGVRVCLCEIWSVGSLCDVCVRKKYSFAEWKFVFVFGCLSLHRYEMKANLRKLSASGHSCRSYLFAV